MRPIEIIPIILATKNDQTREATGGATLRMLHLTRDSSAPSSKPLLNEKTIHERPPEGGSNEEGLGELLWTTQSPP